MQYSLYEEFPASLYKLYQKNGQYRKAALRVLAVLGKIQLSNMFQESQAFEHLSTTKNGENRLRYGVKYSLERNSRLVTIQHNNSCMFLYVGTHEEVDSWLNSKKKFLDSSEPLVAVNNITSIISSYAELGKSQVVDNHQNTQPCIAMEAQLTSIKERLISDSRDFQLSTTIPHELNSKSLSKIKKDLIKQDITHVQSYIDVIRLKIKNRALESAYDDIGDLSYYTDFLRAKIYYANLLSNNTISFKSLQ